MYLRGIPKERPQETPLAHRFQLGCRVEAQLRLVVVPEAGGVPDFRLDN